MKKLKKPMLIVAAVIALSFTTKNGEMKPEGSVQIISNNFELTPKSEYSKLLTPALLKSIVQKNHSKMAAEEGVERTEVKLEYFTPPAWEDKFAYCQIAFYRGEVRETSYVLFYPDGESGKLSEHNYTISEKRDYPCDVCQFERLEITKEEQIIGHFSDVLDPTLISTKVMDYNFREMHVAWN